MKIHVKNVSSGTFNHSGARNKEKLLREKSEIVLIGATQTDGLPRKIEPLPVHSGHRCTSLRITLLISGIFRKLLLCCTRRRINGRANAATRMTPLG